MTEVTGLEREDLERFREVLVAKKKEKSFMFRLRGREKLFPEKK